MSEYASFTAPPWAEDRTTRPSMHHNSSGSHVKFSPSPVVKLSGPRRALDGRSVPRPNGSPVRRLTEECVTPCISSCATTSRDVSGSSLASSVARPNTYTPGALRAEGRRDRDGVRRAEVDR